LKIYTTTPHRKVENGQDRSKEQNVTGVMIMPRKSTKTTKKTTVNNSSKQDACTTRFTLYNFSGKEKAHYLVERKSLDQDNQNLGKPPIAHSIIIIDRSGSMYGAIEELKENLIKLLTLDEYLNSQLVITLISYASKGDVTCHFQRIPISEIMKTNSPHIQEIKSIETGCFTCISQSMEIAKILIKEFVIKQEEGELTAITLHTDGCANDPSYQTELRKIEEICTELKAMNVLVNTIAYGGWADFKFLAKIANTTSGNCIQTGNIKEIYNSLYQTTNLLSGAVSPPFEETLIKGYDYQVFVSKTVGKIIGSTNTLKIVGLKPEDEGVFYKYKKISQEEYEKLTDIPVAQTDESVFAFIKANLAEGNLNLAKYGLVSTFDATLTEKHAKALTNSEIVEFTQDIEKVVFQPSILENHEILSQVKVSDKITVIELLGLLENNKKSIIINLKNLEENYCRRGIKRIEGKRDENGKIIEPELKTEPIDGNEYVEMGSFEINRNTATINMLITRRVKLVRKEDNKQITEVAGILVNDLKQYNNYTIVGDGEININSLRVKINNREVFELLKSRGVLEKDGKTVDNFDFHSEYDIRLDNLPLMSYDSNFNNLDGLFEKLAQMQILSSIIAAHLKDESDIYTLEQVEELKQHYLSKNLYLNFPTTTEYSDLQTALNKGEVDIRISYKIDIGNKDIINLSKLYSANKFLDRLYEGFEKNTGEKIETPTFQLTLDNEIIFGHKTLSKRTKITEVDNLMKIIFDDFLGLANNGSVADILTEIKANQLLTLLQAKNSGQTISKDEFIANLSNAKNQLNYQIEKIYRQEISPLVFYIGSTGLIPDELETQALTSDEINAKYSDLKLSKDEKDGMFFEVGDTIISVYTKNEYFSTK